MKHKRRLFFSEEYLIIAEQYSNELQFNEKQTLVQAVQGAKTILASGFIPDLP